MRNLAIILGLSVLFAGHAKAIDLVFEWDAAPPEWQVESYNIYERTGPAEAVKIGNSKEATFTVQGIAQGMHRYEVTLVNLWGESVAYAVGETPPVIPSPLQPVPLKFKVINLQASVDMQEWKNIAAIPVPVSDRQFFRIAFAD